jgi:hypothetical protein
MAEEHSESEDVIARWGNHGEGWELLDCEPILLPFVRLSMEVLELKRSKFPPLDLYVLRALQEGVGSIDDLAGLLGIETALAEERVIDLCRKDLVHRGEILRLSDSGVAAVDGNLMSPERTHLEVSFDKVLYEPVPLSTRELRPPQDYRKTGRYELSAASRINPKIADIDLVKLEAVTRNRRPSGGSIIAIQSMTPRRFVVPGHLLVWQSKTTHQMDFAVVVAGALSEPHSDAVDRLGGLDFLKVQVDLTVEERDPIAEVFGSDLAADLLAQATPLDEIERIREATSNKQRQIESLQREVTAEPELLDETVQKISALEAEVQRLEQELRKINVRLLDTVECREQFKRFRRATTSRLLVVAPWLTGRVVDSDFAAEIEALCQKGVEVHIGWGYPEDETAPGKTDDAAESRLHAIAAKHSNLTLGFLGDTHEKVLVADDVAVVGSFNWLSFGGRMNKQQRLRRESALYVRMSDKADIVYNTSRDRIDRAAAKGQTRTPEGYGTRPPTGARSEKRGKRSGGPPRN